MRRFGSTKLAGAAIRSALRLTVIVTLLLIAALPALAQTETVLYNFSGTDGSVPQSRLTSDGKGNFYGTTFSGGLSGLGVVFKLSPNSSGGWTETVIHSFCSGPIQCADGANPYTRVIFDRAGNLYGTTSWGGGPDGHANGVVFELSPVGTSWKETVLYSFTDSVRSNPDYDLIFDSTGNLYGTTTTFGYQETLGYVFELSPSADGWTERAIYPNVDSVGLVIDAAGNVFGGGLSGQYSTVFELSPNGSGGWNSTVIYSFAGGYNYTLISLSMFDKVGSLYGTTFDGGAYGAGTIYKLSLGRNGEWTKKILYSFRGKKDGGFPTGAIVFDGAGNIYGTTAYGGKSGSGGPTGAGTIFKLEAPKGKGSYKEKVLWSFNGTDGKGPVGGLIMDTAGNLYGTTSEGGKSGRCVGGCGVVFEIIP